MHWINYYHVTSKAYNPLIDSNKKLTWNIS